VDLELVGTDAFLLYASNLLTGRISATEITPTWNVPSRQTDLYNVLRETTTTWSVSDAFASVRPPQPEYEALLRALSRYRSIAVTGGWPTVPDGHKLERGSTREAVVRLCNRLSTTSDRPSSDQLTEGATTEFGDGLHRAVLRFLERHGLEADGVVGSRYAGCY